MENPRPEKVAVVDELRQQFDDADGALLTEYRGIDVAAMATLRRSLRAAGADYKIYKNTLVRLAVRDLDAELDDLLTGPTAIAFVRPGDDGRPGDAAAVAKALKEFAKTNEALVIKGGLLGTTVLSAKDADALADLPSKEVLLAQFAGLLQAPLTKFAQLLNAVPSKFAYGLQALIEAGGAPGAPAEPVTTESPSEPDATPEATDAAAAEPEAASEAQPEAATEPEAASDAQPEAATEPESSTENDIPTETENQE